jgi:hypothetical protein
MPMSASNYLNTADSLANRAMNEASPERESFYTAMSQATAIAAVAAAIERLAEGWRTWPGRARREARLAAPRIHLAHVPPPPLPGVRAQIHR